MKRLWRTWKHVGRAVLTLSRRRLMDRQAPLRCSPATLSGVFSQTNDQRSDTVSVLDLINTSGWDIEREVRRWVTA